MATNRMIKPSFPQPDCQACGKLAPLRKEIERLRAELERQKTTVKAASNLIQLNEQMARLREDRIRALGGTHEGRIL